MQTLIEMLQNGLGASDVALLVNRVALGTFFVLSGYHKLFNATRHKSLIATLQASHVPLLSVNQWFVPGVEFMGGLALIAGLLAPLAALGLLVICLVATCTDGLGRITAWSPLDRGDYLDDVLYLPEVVYCVGLVVVMLLGSGSYTILAEPALVGVGSLYVAFLYLLCRRQSVRSQS